MLTELQTMTSLECAPSFLTFNCSVKDGTAGACLSPVTHGAAKKSGKKPTRQWAAWTRQEEESFFTALRQFGKNFEKITSRVQSKNKDQVRHYYYRLFRRMNKLLGPGLSLDAKNSKETIAAMLCWWSLLDKYSCKASKLHLKPRRFKLFVEALEHQLVKDRKKSMKMRHSQGENYAPSASMPVGTQTRAIDTEASIVKLVLVDSQNIPKSVSGKVNSSAPRCNMSLGVNHVNKKGDTYLGKMPRQRKKTGTASATSYRKWEKAAIAGVSLVADAAEHLERAAFHQGPEKELGNFVHSDNILPQTVASECNAQSSVKLKLQLFPIDEATRRALETDKLNPFLELTLSNRKKISSVLEHLTRKWGSSSIAAGTLMLFPYNVNKENLASSQRWCQDSCVSIGDVNMSIGNPTLFRLRYGWMFPETGCPAPASQAYLSSPRAMNLTCQEEQQIDCDCNVASNEQACLEMQNIHEIACYPPKNTKMDNHGTLGIAQVGRTVAVSVGEWADSLTNMSIGDLLTEVSDEINGKAADQPSSVNAQYFEQNPFTCDSFDAAIAAHIYKHQNKTVPSAFTSTSSSFFDSEDTCDAFSFRRKLDTSEDFSSIPVVEPMPGNQSSLVDSDCSPEELSKAEDIPCGHHLPQVDEDLLESNILNEVEVAKDLNGLTDLYWPDSLGPLDLEIPSCNYHSADLILSDSLGGLIASSLDAFQSCSYGTDKKVGSPAADGPSKDASFPKFKTDNTV